MAPTMKPQKSLILDTGILINLSMNGLLYILEKLKSPNLKFLITEQVKYEIIDRPISIPRFELGALRVKTPLEKSIIELPTSLKISNDKIKSITKDLMHIANHSVKSRGKWINIVSDAEISCLALSTLLTKKGIVNIVGIDERTTRILSERPQNLEKLMSKKLRSRVQLESKNFAPFKQFRFLRSTELVYVAHKKGILKVKGPKALEAVIYATKYKGSSISHEEINEMKNL
jgi:hypothetical protein